MSFDSSGSPDRPADNRSLPGGGRDLEAWGAIPGPPLEDDYTEYSTPELRGSSAAAAAAAQALRAGESRGHEPDSAPSVHGPELTAADVNRLRRNVAERRAVQDSLTRQRLERAALSPELHRSIADIPAPPDDEEPGPYSGPIADAISRAVTTEKLLLDDEATPAKAGAWVAQELNARHTAALNAELAAGSSPGEILVRAASWDAAANKVIGQIRKGGARALSTLSGQPDAGTDKWGTPRDNLPKPEKDVAGMLGRQPNPTATGWLAANLVRQRTAIADSLVRRYAAGASASEVVTGAMAEVASDREAVVANADLIAGRIDDETYRTRLRSHQPMRDIPRRRGSAD